MTLHPNGAPGCHLLVTLDAVTMLPANPALVGVVLHQQVLQLERDALSRVTWLGGSNRLVLTAGVF